VNSPTPSSREIKRAFNFNGGPAALPLSVLERIREELFDYRGTGMSVMELTHRSAEFEEILSRAEQNLRRLMEIPEEYAVIFLQADEPLRFREARGRVAHRDVDGKSDRGTGKGHTVPIGGFDRTGKIQARTAEE
jgi:phosphoserine aminotransferase